MPLLLSALKWAKKVIWCHSKSGFSTTRILSTPNTVISFARRSGALVVQGDAISGPGARWNNLIKINVWPLWV